MKGQSCHLSIAKLSASAERTEFSTAYLTVPSPAGTWRFRTTAQLPGTGLMNWPTCTSAVSLSIAIYYKMWPMAPSFGNVLTVASHGFRCSVLSTVALVRLHGLVNVSTHWTDIAGLFCALSDLNRLKPLWPSLQRAWCRGSLQWVRSRVEASLAICTALDTRDAIATCKLYTGFAVTV